MLYPVVAAIFQKIAKPHQVRLDVAGRIGDACSYPGLRSHVQHGVRREHGRQFFPCGGIFNIHFAKAEKWMLKPFQAVGFQLGVVIAVDIVDAKDGMPQLQKPQAEVKADKAGRSGYQNVPAFRRCW